MIEDAIRAAVSEAVAEEFGKYTAALATRPEPIEDRCYSLEEAAAYLGSIPVSTVRLRIQSGELEAFKLGKHLLVPAASLRSFVQRQLQRTRFHLDQRPLPDLDGVDDDISRELGLTAK